MKLQEILTQDLSMVFQSNPIYDLNNMSALSSSSELIALNYDGMHHREFIFQVCSSKFSEGDVSYYQLFDAANALAKEAAHRNNSTDEKNEKQIEHLGNFVGVTGHAGIGKSTFTKFFAKKILSDAFLDVDYVFFLQFRNINYGKKMNLLEFLTSRMSIFEGEQRENVDDLLRELEKSDRVLLLMDGLDEALLDGMNQHFTKMCSSTAKEKPEIFIKNILHGNILPRAKKLITSKPSQMYKLHEDYRPKFIVSISGLNEEAQKKICRVITGENDNRTEAILKVLKSNHDLQSYCWVPRICVLIMSCLNGAFEKSDHNSHLVVQEFLSMGSLTTIMITAMTLLVNVHNNSSNKVSAFQLENLCYLAYTCFEANHFCFDLRDLDNANISHESSHTFLTLGFVSSSSLKITLMEGQKRFSFAHLILQELLVALHLKLFISVAEFMQLNGKLKSGKYQMVTKFLYGLNSSAALKSLDTLFKACNLNLELSKENELSKKDMLKKMVVDQINDLHRSTSKKSIFRGFLICTWLYEMRDDKFAQSIVSELQDKIVLTGEILPSDIQAFYYMFHFKKAPLHLSVVHSHFIGEALKNFFFEMEKLKKTNNKKVKLYS